MTYFQNQYYHHQYQQHTVTWCTSSIRWKKRKKKERKADRGMLVRWWMLRRSEERWTWWCWCLAKARCVRWGAVDSPSVPPPPLTTHSTMALRSALSYLPATGMDARPVCRSVAMVARSPTPPTNFWAVSLKHTDHKNNLQTALLYIQIEKLLFTPFTSPIRILYSLSICGFIINNPSFICFPE